MASKHDISSDSGDSGDDEQFQQISKKQKTEPETFIAMNDWAGPYKSRFLDLHKDLGKLLKHVNCSYLSTRGQAPTLLELKQHAQALAVLIKHLTVSTGSTAIDSEAPGKEDALQKVYAFDFLADLSTEYINKDEGHALPLTGCMNVLEDRGVRERGGANHCPLHAARSLVLTRPGSAALPYATQQNLIMHADEVLERLDHEFSTEGGILGMLPLEGDGTAKFNTLGRNSILGQWIAYTRQMVSRVNELGQNLQEALEIVSGEAVIPKALLHEMPVHRRSNGRLAIQDQWIITTQPDVIPRFKKEFAKLERETVDEEGADVLTIIAKTRYSRLRGGETIFIQPTEDAEPPAPHPAVVQVVKGEWRDRSSLWERKHAEELETLRGYSAEIPAKDREIDSLKGTVEALVSEREQFLVQVGFSNPEWANPTDVVALQKEREEFEEEKKTARAEIARVREQGKAIWREAMKRRDAVDRYRKSGGKDRPTWDVDNGAKL